VLIRFAKCFGMTFSFIFLCATSVHGATINAATCEQTAVSDAVNSASDGDTIVVPAGQCTWTTNLTITNKILTIQGAGIDQTTIVDGLSKDLFPNIPQVLTYNTKAGGLSRITGFTFQGGTLADPYNKGMVAISAPPSAASWRFDHNRFVATMTYGLSVWGPGYGVVDHNVFDLSDWLYGIYSFDDGYGDASWASPSALGTGNAIYIEDNVFRAPSLSVAHDGWSGSRVVFRNNQLTNTIWANHGTESGGRWRGQRSFEVYNNTITHTGPGYSTVVGIRSGVGVVFNNTVTFNPANGFIGTSAVAQNFRSATAYAPWGMCDGSSPWDGNQGASGYPCLDQVGRGQSTLISGDTPSPVRWPQQLVEPTYAWNNTLNGQTSPMVTNSLQIVEGRDFFNNAKPGYTPYAYPHPLVSPTTAPNAPSSLGVR
jgi:hypothetical protein